MLQRRQIVKALADEIDIEDLLCMKYASVSFQSIVWIFISINVTICRTNTLL
jgi:hypothetical protein